VGTRTRTRPDESAKPGYITREGYRNLELEAERLWTVERPALTKAVAIAAAEGDRSENAEYIYGKRKLAEIDRRLQFLGKRLQVLTMVEPQTAPSGRVYFGHWVSLEDEDGAIVCYQIVGPDETEVGGERISVEGPLAMALLTREVGDEVTVQRPKGAITFVVTAIGTTRQEVQG
jgi:transcription elongation factor GreB